MKISGFTYIRNGFIYGYPFVESIRSLLPLCDEVIVAVGDSTDHTRETIQDICPEKIKIVDTVWDDNLREGGKIFAVQANIALDHISGDWGIHLQADEVIHEKDYELITCALARYYTDPQVEGGVFNFLNFYGSYDHIATSRNWHRREVRIVRNIKNIRSYRDSQGFRYYSPCEFNKGNLRGRPLKTFLLDAEIFHYSYVRPPELMQKKTRQFHSYWHDDKWISENVQGDAFDYKLMVDNIIGFSGTHPVQMKELTVKQDWDVTFNKNKRRYNLKDSFLNLIEKWTGWRIGEYKNYRIIRKFIK